MAVIRIVRVLLGYALAVMYAVSSATKLKSPVSFRKAIVDLKVPKAVAKMAFVGTPAAELVITSLLMFARTRRLGFLGSTVVMAVFSGLIGKNLLQGNRVPCACFGELSGESISNKTLGRNVFLTIISALGALGPAPARPLVAGIGKLKSQSLLLVVLSQTALMIILLKRYGDLLRASSGPMGVGQESTSLKEGESVKGDLLISIDKGEQVRLDSLLGSLKSPVNILFLSEDCSSCIQLTNELEADAILERRLLLEESFLLVVPSDNSRASISNLAPGNLNVKVVVDSLGDVTREFGVTRVPALARLDRDGRATERALEGYEQISERLRAAH